MLVAGDWPGNNMRMMHVGVAGLGKMGSSIARNLIDRGFTVSVWDRTRARVDELVRAGATAAADPAALVAGVDATIVMLWGDDVAREVTLGQIVPATAKGRLVIESSTLSPSMYETIAKAAAAREVQFLACPVIGSVDSARSGSLTLLPGGDKAAFERADQLLHAMGSTIEFTGSPAASGFLKLAANSVLGVIADSIGELLNMMERGGVDRTLAIDTLIGAFGRAGGKRQQLLEGDTRARFSAGALLKDLRLAQAARQSVGVEAPVMDCVLTAFEKTAQGAVVDLDYIAVALARDKASIV